MLKLLQKNNILNIHISDLRLWCKYEYSRQQRIEEDNAADRGSVGECCVTLEDFVEPSPP